jgi:hypothetical protein
MPSAGAVGTFRHAISDWDRIVCSLIMRKYLKIPETIMVDNSYMYLYNRVVASQLAHMLCCHRALLVVC